MRRPETIMEIRKKTTFLAVINKSIIKITIQSRKSNRVVVFQTFLNTGATDQTFQQSGKQDSFRHIWESLASILKSSDSQFFRPTTGIQPGPDTFGKLRHLETQP